MVMIDRRAKRPSCSELKMPEILQAILKNEH